MPTDEGRSKQQAESSPGQGVEDGSHVSRDDVAVVPERWAKLEPLRNGLARHEAYGDPESGIAATAKSRKDEPDIGMMLPVCTGPLSYTGQDAILASTGETFWAVEQARGGSHD